MIRYRLSTVIDSYLAFRASNGFAANTVKNDRQTLARLAAHYDHDPIIDSITPRDIDDLLGSLAQGGYSIGTVNNTQSGLSAFFKWCRTRGITAPMFDPIAGRRYFPAQDKPRLYIPLADFPKVLDACTSPRDRALMALGLYTLGRQSEIINLRVKHLDLASGHLSMTIFKSYKSDVMPLSSELDSEMRRWLLAYQEECGPLDKNWFLVPAVKNAGQFGNFILAPDRRISKSEDIVRRVVERCGYTDERMGMHLIRRSAARAAFDEMAKDGYDGALRVVSALLHHASTATTEHYLDLGLDRQRRNARIAGQPLFPSLVAPNVVPLKEESDGIEDDQVLRQLRA
jgi:integrase